MSVVFLNGEYLPKDEARVSVNDRGFLFADGIYEVTPAYRGRLFRWDHHLARMRKGLAAIAIDFDAAVLKEVKLELLARNALDDVPVAYVYVQVTRGVAPRTHAFPDPPVEPTVYAFANEYHRPSMQLWGMGSRAITMPDQRWARADIKAIALLPNVLAQQAAVDAGVINTILVRDGMAIEGTHNNLFAVINGVVTTAPKSNYILHGVTRDFVIELAGQIGFPVEERAIPLSELYDAEEVFFTGTTTEVRPAIRVDDQMIGDGHVGPFARALFEKFLEVTGG
ncbi:MAG: aminotransferase class IV [Gemmatimonadetes bacterium]|nr:aminotransferase class IV [Gemmatimonadota bacterium]MCY3676310.1 aminotransferase class IV [Gemmatimonadota bacterium]MYA42794.1 D-amino acid aminotransferase [Gemmatimonadota bacterium]MYE92536.1 D-amino acid aminotransferase [Gemmatimonadota bacterium]MYJ09082.1 D-amino acid aminotransferase [Gemmatimonadota bacterium]